MVAGTPQPYPAYMQLLLIPTTHRSFHTASKSLLTAPTATEQKG